MKIPLPFTIYDSRFTIGKKSADGASQMRNAECGMRNKNAAAGGGGSLFNHGWTRINTDKNAATSGAGSFRTCADVPVFSQIVNRKSQIVNRRDVPPISLRTPHSALRTPTVVNRKSFQKGIALVITLIMLSVTLLMAVAFLALAKRERGSVTTTTDTTTARLAAETAVANAEAQIVAGILTSLTNGGSANAYNLNLLVSTNYINPLGYTTGSSNPTNVNYFYPSGKPLDPSVSAPDYNQNIANLFFLPRAPVFVPTNNLGSNDFRYYLDLNQNGQFDPSGWVPDAELQGVVLVTNGTIFQPGGDPEWVGVLQHPDATHGPNNPFISRYAFIALPVGNSLDLNSIHNEAYNVSHNLNPNMNPAADGFFRNQGVGSWEINLAAFLADLNTNEWDSPVSGGVYNYLTPSGLNNNGAAFYDASSLLSYRYDNNYFTLANVDGYFTNLPNYPFGIDGYSDGPWQTTLDTNAALFSDNLNSPWSGASNTNHFFTLGDFFNPAIAGGGLGSFTNRLHNAGGSIDTYDRYTFYRMLAQLGTDSSPDEGKLNLNYSNALVSYKTIPARGGIRVTMPTSIGVVPGAETNLVPWRPQDFFIAAADKLLRAYTTNWFQAGPSNYLATYCGVVQTGYIDATGLGVTNQSPFLGPSNQIPVISITNIPVYVNGSFVYSPAVHRLLQLAANLYDATTTANYNLPHVFRPIFERDNFGNVFIVGYTNLNSIYGPNTVAGANDPQLAPPYDPTMLSSSASIQNFTPITSPLAAPSPAPGIGGYTFGPGLVNVYGVPWIIGAKKGLPGFNQLYLTNTVQLNRKLEFIRPSIGAALSTYTTNQMYVMGINTGLGISFWNPYTNNYYPRTGQVNIYASDAVYMSLTNGSGALAAPMNGYATFPVNTQAFPYWPGAQWSGSPPSANPSTASFITANWSFNFINPSVYSFNNKTFSTLNTWETDSPPLPQLPQFGLNSTNYLQALIMDGNNVIDYVQLRSPITTVNLNQTLADQNGGSGTYWQWSVNPYVSPTPNYGVYDQWFVSGHPGSVPTEGGAWASPGGFLPPAFAGVTPAQVPTAEATFFNSFFTPSSQFQVNRQIYVNTNLIIQAPYTPSRTIFSSFLLQANDPLVHYLASDLNAQTGDSATWGNGSIWTNGYWSHVDNLGPQNPLPTAPPNPIGGRYQPWGQNKQMANVGNLDVNAYELAYKDPLAWEPDNWDFPTNLYPSVGWIGRVHRGTPWQTVYLKSRNILTNMLVVGSAGLVNVGTNTWTAWTGDNLSTYGQYYDAANSAPVSDRLLFDLFTTRLNDNAVRGTLPVNQAHLAAWSALFSGMVALSNNTPDLSLALTPPLTYLATNAYLPIIINPAGVDLANAPVSVIANSIDTTRITNFPFQVFTHAGDILQTPALTEQSPFLNWNDSMQQQLGISDELYEWLPQQMMGLVRLGEPRYVLYCYGQTLHPAPGGQVLGGPFFQLITNYQVAAESAVRAVIRIDGANTSTPHAVIESYNVLPPN
jgi:hypothetical protein